MIPDISDNRKNIITAIVKSCRNARYLELGVDNGSNINYIATNTHAKCFGVDINKPTITDGFKFFNCTTDEFFYSNLENNYFDVIFIDANHSIDSVIHDFDNSLECLGQNGVIILHDVDPESSEYVDDSGKNYSANAYKIIDYIYNNYQELNVIVLPIDETGLALVNRKDDRRINNYM